MSGKPTVTFQKATKRQLLPPNHKTNLAAHANYGSNKLVRSQIKRNAQAGVATVNFQRPPHNENGAYERAKQLEESLKVPPKQSWFQQAQKVLGFLKGGTRRRSRVKTTRKRRVNSKN